MSFDASEQIYLAIPLLLTLVFENGSNVIHPVLAYFLPINYRINSSLAPYCRPLSTLCRPSPLIFFLFYSGVLGHGPANRVVES
jgi:hypothetical protein